MAPCTSCASRRDPAPLEGLEPPTARLENGNSIRLSYRGVWRRRRELNPRMTVLQTVALPPWLLRRDVRSFSARRPSRGKSRRTVRRGAKKQTPGPAPRFRAGPNSSYGTESGRWDLNPRHPAWEASALPLSYARIWGSEDPRVSLHPRKLRRRVEVLGDRVALTAPDVTTGTLRMPDRAELLLAKLLRPELDALALGVATVPDPLLVLGLRSRFASTLLRETTLPALVESALSCPMCHDDHPFEFENSRGREPVAARGRCLRA